MNEADRIVLLISIISRGKSKVYMKMLNHKNIRYHLQSIGQGTAPSEMMDIFGLGSNDKDIIMSFASANTVDTITGEIGRNVDTNSSYGGLMIVLPLAAMNRISAEIVFRSSQKTNNKGVGRNMSNNCKYHYIFITVNQGYADQVMQTAKRAGATGGTVIKSRLAGTENLEQYKEIEVTEEKEIVMILAPVSISNQILNDVSQEHGMKTPAQGMVCALPVEKAIKI